MHYYLRWIFLWSFFAQAQAAEIRFSSIVFSENGAPASVTCRFRIAANMQIEPSMVLLAPNQIKYRVPKLNLISRTKDYYEIEATIDLTKEWIEDVKKFLLQGKWRIHAIDGGNKQIPDDKGFIKVIEISDNMMIGFSLGPVDLDQDAQEFIKKLRNVGEKQPSEPAPPVRLDK